MQKANFIIILDYKVQCQQVVISNFILLWIPNYFTLEQTVLTICLLQLY